MNRLSKCTRPGAGVLLYRSQVGRHKPNVVSCTKIQVIRRYEKVGTIRDLGLRYGVPESFPTSACLRSGRFFGLKVRGV